MLALGPLLLVGEVYATSPSTATAARPARLASLETNHVSIPPTRRYDGGTYTRRRNGRAGDSGGRPTGGSKTDCVYAANTIGYLRKFERSVGRVFGCVLVFNNAAPNWAAWETPWFVNAGHPTADENWQAWANADPARRQLIISQNLFPSDLDGSDWLEAGARGAYVEHARRLARNLVAAGLASSVIRLAHEANDTGAPYALGSTDSELRLWREFWRRTVIAMRSVPGAHFLFDWCINAYWRPIPLREWYPGNDVVDIIGIDAYDSGVPSGQIRWRRISTQPDGILDVLRFAKAHGKPMSLPEWGLIPAAPTELGGGNDPSYINGIARIVRDNPVAYQSYFYNHSSATLLRTNPQSLAAYRRHFGAHGDTTATHTISPGF